MIWELSTAFKSNGWLLSATASSNPAAIDGDNYISQFTQYLDWISLITHDYDRTLDELHAFDNLDIDITVQNWIQQGAPSKKIVLGISSGGQSFTVKNSVENGRTDLDLGKGILNSLCNMM